MTVAGHHHAQATSSINAARRLLAMGSVLTLLAFGLGNTGCSCDESSGTKHPTTMESSDGARYLTHEIIVQKAPDVSMEDLRDALADAGGTIMTDPSNLMESLGFYRVVLEQEVIADVIISELSENGLVDGAERNYIVEVEGMPDDSLIEELWGMRQIDAQKAWKVSNGSPEIIVAVTDTGVDLTHEDLAANIWSNAEEIPGNHIDDDNNGFIDDVYGWDWADDDPVPQDVTGHGTHCAGTIGAVGNNGVGVAGVSWQVKLMALKFMDATNQGTLWNAAQAVLYAARHNARVVNASWGCNGCYASYMTNAIEELEQAGGLFVAAAGNKSVNIDDVPFYPAAHVSPNLISVTATAEDDTVESSSNWGPTKVHVAAPGRAIMSTEMNNAYGLRSGTSMAAPHVAGLAALYLSTRPEATYAEVKQRLIDTSDPAFELNGKVEANGRINARRMLTDDSIAPPRPESFSVVAGSKSDAQLSWSAVDAPDLSMYRVRWGTASGEYAFVLDLPALMTTAVIENLVNETPYFFVVHAVDANNNESLPSDEQSIIPGDQVSPAQVLDLSAQPLSTKKASGYVYAASSEASDYYRAYHAYDGSPDWPNAVNAQLSIIH